ncbi:Septin domain-containing protein [Rozella allomycis CSF55]|uniref:Septin domain-containing protein n=1 Tax=Rozella allomycis (strain CSF55) TaxID=988480 RepID=A0A075APF0_ROZAC|nr:Septin domain-containing protein [Rozella allomycis CSF55]|eukprot:EPZ31956.1 Septin domain-containing protein [Rozella allomycis CSF55]
MTDSRSLARKNIKKGLNFTIMTVGHSGLGKTTFVNTLLETTVIPKKEIPDGYHSSLPKEIDIQTYTLDIDEGGNKISVSIVDTPGFGDSLNNTDSPQKLMEYLETQFDEFLAEETRIKRNPKSEDKRVHVILYFISPFGHSLKEIDIQTMKLLSKRANIIPVIAKADGLNATELQHYKRRIMEDIRKFQIPIYDFPFDPEEDDAEFIKLSLEMRNCLPFALIGADHEMVENGRRKRGRMYPWGFVDVDNPKHSDFSKLKKVLLNTNLNDLKEITQLILYENYRTEKLSEGMEMEEGQQVPEAEVSA